MFRDIFKREAPEASSDKCGKVDSFVALKQAVKSFTSPDFPNNYPVDLELCTWRIRTHPGNRIIVNILSIDVEHERKCQYDYLVLYDGPDASSPKIGQYCGKTPPPSFTSTTSQVFVTFHSDSEVSLMGFEIEYQAVGDFDDLVIEGPNDDDSQEVFDSSTEENGSAEPSIGGGEQGDMEGPDGVTVDPDGAFLDGDNSDEDTDSQTVEEHGKCDQIWHNARQGNITSPGYPGQYPNKVDCTIEINAPINSRIDLTFISFDLEEICTFDYVIIKNSTDEDTEPIGTYCGNEVPGLIQSYTSQLIINFVSDIADQRGGFFASFTTQESERKNTGLSKQPDGDNTLEFSIEPMDSLDLQEGDFVRKVCEVNKEGAAIVWYKDDEELPEGEETDGMLIGDGGKTLLIPSMEAKHEGGFICAARLPGGPPILAPFLLQITNEDLELPEYVDSLEFSEDDSQEDSVQFETVPIAANITEGINQYFFCSTNKKSVELVWEKDGDPLSYNNRIYKIFEANLLVGDAKIGDSGRYSCIAYSKQYPYTTLGEASAYLTVTSSLDVSDVCGIVSAREVTGEESSEEDRGRIVNGKTALKGSSPWIARLWSRANMEPFCGGSLINDHWVVSAAHCFDEISRPEQLEVRLGDHDTIFIEREEMPFRVSRYILHPDYNDVTLDRDIALIELEGRVPVYTDYIKPICLPNESTSKKLLVPGKTARVAGWGQIIEDGAYPRFLKELNIPIVSESKCLESTDDRVTDSMFCAGFSQASKGDSCEGDSGGPLAQEEDGKWYMTGIVSWGEGCAREGKYGFYTNVTQFNKWLTESMTS